MKCPNCANHGGPWPETPTLCGGVPCWQCDGVCTVCEGEEDPSKWALEDLTEDQIRRATRTAHGLPPEPVEPEDIYEKANVESRIDFYALMHFRARRTGAGATSGSPPAP